MSVVLLSLPIAAFVASWATLHGAAGQARSDWRDSFLRAAVVWGTLVAVSAEALSWFGAVRQIWLAAFWAIVLLAWLALGLRNGSWRSTWRWLAAHRLSLAPGERLILLGIALVVVVLLLIAWVSPPNNYDSYLYHMARVVHWAQAGSLDHFPSGYEHQLTKPTWAETAILHLRVLWGDDKPANLVQWFSMVGSLVGVSAIAGLLGASRRVQLLAATVVLSIPMGILQATSTQNDYAVAMWAVCLAYFVVRHGWPRETWSAAIYVGLAAGLGLLTKGTGYVYAVPFLAWYFWPRRPWPRRSWLRDLGIVAVLAVVLNLGFWWRNVVTFGGPFGTSEWLSANLTLGPALISGAPATGTVTPTPSDQSPEGLPAAEEAAEAGGSAGAGGPLTVFSGIASKLLGVPARLGQIVAYQLVTPFGRSTRLLLRAMEAFPGALDTASIERVRRAWNHEDLAPSPLHMVIAIVALAGVWFLRPRERWRALRAYTLVVGLTFLLLPVAIGHGASLWGIRYVLPFFVLMAAEVALVISGTLPSWGPSAVALGLVAFSLPWTLDNKARPLIQSPDEAVQRSVLIANPARILLSNISWEYENYTNASDEVSLRGCREVGLFLPDNYPEYPFWWLLDAPQSGVRIESLYHSAYTEKYVDPAFEPCMVICSTCAEGVEFPGYSPVARYGPLTVFEREQLGG